MLVINRETKKQVGRFTWDYTETYSKFADIVDEKTGRVLGTFEVNHYYDGFKRNYSDSAVYLLTPPECQDGKHVQDYRSSQPDVGGTVALGHKRNALAWVLSNAHKVDFDAYGEDNKDRIFEQRLDGTVQG